MERVDRHIPYLRCTHEAVASLVRRPDLTVRAKPSAGLEPATPSVPCCCVLTELADCAVMESRAAAGLVSPRRADPALAGDSLGGGCDRLFSRIVLDSYKFSGMPFAASPLYVAKATLFRTLGHPARVRILELLRDGEHSVGAYRRPWISTLEARRSISLRSGGSALSGRAGKGRGVLPRCRPRCVRLARRGSSADRPDTPRTAGAPGGARFGVTALVVAASSRSWQVGCSVPGRVG